MKKWIMYLAFSAYLVVSIPTTFSAVNNQVHIPAYTATKTTLEKLTPSEALTALMNGNKRFIHNQPMPRHLLQQAKATSLNGQFPSSIILSCMDSRVSPELIFNQGLGDIFSVRIAGNIIDTDQLGGLEYATHIVGSKLVVIMGHTQCGAVKGACENVKLGNLTNLLEKIQPAVQTIKQEEHHLANCHDYSIVDKIAKQNVLNMMEQVKLHSSIIRDKIDNKKILLVGAMHDLTTGSVVFFNEQGITINQ